MAKRGPNGKKLNGRPEFPPAENSNGLDMGQRVVVYAEGVKVPGSFRWSGRYFPGAARKAKEGRRLAAERRQERCADHGLAREIREGYRNEYGTPGANKTQVDRRTPERIIRESNQRSLSDSIAVMDAAGEFDDIGQRPWDDEPPNIDQMGLESRTTARLRVSNKPRP